MTRSVSSSVFLEEKVQMNVLDNKEETMTTKEIADVLGTYKKVIIENARKFLSIFAQR